MILGKSVLWALILIPCLLAQSSSNNSNRNTSNRNNNNNDNSDDDNNSDDNNSYELNRTSENITFPQSVILDMASREMRYHHYLWHQVRDGWLRFTPEVQARYTEIGWAPPRPARTYDENGVATMLYDNDSGEDFLYMHRQMILRANEVSARNNESFGNMTGWKRIPAPGDEEYPVPPVYNITDDESTTASTTRRKTDEFYYDSILPQEEFFMNPNRLRTLTLGQLGARIEITVHGWIHMRFSSNCSYGYRPGYIRRNNLPYIDPMWDDPEYNWLGDSYASQAHPLFWKIHGWVDDRIEDWKAANNITEIEWKGTWVGGPMSNITMLTNVVTSSFKTKQSLRGPASGSGSMAEMEAMGTSSESESVSGNMNVLEEAFKIFAESGVPESRFADIATEYETIREN